MLLIASIFCVVVAAVAFVYSAQFARRGQTGLSIFLMLAGSSTPPVAGLLVTVTSLMGAFGRTAEADPSTKSTMLAEGISGAMNSTALGLLFGLLLALSGTAMLVIIANQRKTAPATDSLQSTAE